MEFETGPILPPQDGVGGDFEGAGAQFVRFREEIHQIARVHHGTVGAEVPVPLALLDAPGNEHPGELLAGDANPGIGLGILEENVVLGFVLLDEVVLQKEGIGLGIHYGELGVGNLAYQDAGFGVQALRRHKILRHPLVEVLGLSHINNLSLGVIISVDAGGMGE